jgi:hypothetical protein
MTGKGSSRKDGDKREKPQECLDPMFFHMLLVFNFATRSLS